MRGIFNGSTKVYYNPGQNIWHKVKKYSKIGEDYKNLRPSFVFFDCFRQSFNLARKTGH